MMLVIVSIIVALLFSTITDLRSREVPDWVSFGTIGTGLGLAIISTMYSGNWAPLLSSLAGLATGVAVGYAMYYAGQWGGGDAKLIMGLGALIGLDFITRAYPFGIFLLNTILAGAAYGLGWMIYMIARKYSEVKKVMKEKLSTLKKWRYASYGLVVILGIIFFISNNLRVQLLALLFSVAAVGMVYVWALTKTVEEVCMIKELPVGKLSEGDWIVKEIKYKSKLIAGPKDLGISREQIAQLKKLNIKKVTVKEGIPFVPSFLLAYTALLIWGNWISGLFVF